MTFDEPTARRQLADVLERREAEIVERWMEIQRRESANPFATAEGTQLDEARDLVASVREALAASDVPIGRVVADFEPLRTSLVDLSGRRARQGSSPTGTALGVLGLKYALVDVLQEEAGGQPALSGAELVEAVICVNRIIDAAGLLTFETYVQGREEIIHRQNQQLLELSTPVVRLWDEVLAVPLIGTLDSSRTQVVTENLLQAIQDHEARVAIIDITGVPTVDTLVAQHLLQTVTATRLMGADCIISGIRPQTAQTIAQLGIDLADIITRASLADALSTAIELVRTSASASEVRQSAITARNGAFPS
jgi:rsbT co-antagonist protein RsbR